MGTNNTIEKHRNDMCEHTYFLFLRRSKRMIPH